VDDISPAHACGPERARETPKIGRIASRFVDRARRLKDQRYFHQWDGIQAAKRRVSILSINEIGLAGYGELSQSASGVDGRRVDSIQQV